MDIKGGLSLWFPNFLYKKLAGSGVYTHANNEKWAQQQHKSIIKKNLKNKVLA